MSDTADNVQPKITVDYETDVLYIRLADGIGTGEVASSEPFELRSRESEAVFDFDADGHLLGIEIIGIENIFRPGKSNSR